MLKMYKEVMSPFVAELPVSLVVVYTIISSSMAKHRHDYLFLIGNFFVLTPFCSIPCMRQRTLWWKNPSALLKKDIHWNCKNWSSWEDYQWPTQDVWRILVQNVFLVCFYNEKSLGSHYPSKGLSLQKNPQNLKRFTAQKGLKQKKFKMLCLT